MLHRISGFERLPMGLCIEFRVVVATHGDRNRSTSTEMSTQSLDVVSHGVREPWDPMGISSR